MHCCWLFVFIRANKSRLENNIETLNISMEEPERNPYLATEKLKMLYIYFHSHISGNENSLKQRSIYYYYYICNYAGIYLRQMYEA